MVGGVSKAQCAQDEQHDDHEADEIDDVVHDDLLTLSGQRQQRSVVPLKPDGCFAVQIGAANKWRAALAARPSKLRVARVFTDG